MKTAIIYILCYDANTEAKARTTFGHHLWARIIQMPTTIYMENWMYFEYLDAHVADWESYDYVGTLSWKAPQKMLIPDMNKLLTLAEETNPDVLALFSYPKKTLIEQATEANFETAWIRWLQQLDYTDEASCDPTIQLFLCNYWLAKPQCMSAYIEFAKRARYVLDTYRPLRNLLWADSKFSYTISQEKCMHIYGRPYYPLHCFLMERLPCIFFHNEKTLVLHSRFWKLSPSSGLWQYVGISNGVIKFKKLDKKK